MWGHLVWIPPRGANAKAAEYNIKIAFMGSIEDEDYDGSVVFKDFVESHSNGQISVDVFPAARLCGNFRECMESVSGGVMEVTISTIGGWGNFMTTNTQIKSPASAHGHARPTHAQADRGL